MFLSIDQLKYMLDQDSYISELLHDKTSLVIPEINHSIMQIGILDLNALDPNMRIIFVKWILGVNKSRIQKGLKPIITLDLIKRCPLWQFINIPYKNLDLTKEAFNSSKRNKAIFNRSNTKRNIR